MKKNASMMAIGPSPALAVLLLVGLLFATLAVPRQAQASDTGWYDLINGTQGNGNFDACTLSGWSSTGGSFDVLQKFVRSAPCSVNGTSATQGTVYQDFVLETYQMEIDSGGGSVEASAYIDPGDSESGKMRLVFFNSAGQELPGGYDSGWATNSKEVWTGLSAAAFTIPTGTARLRIEFGARRTAGSYTDMNIDDVTLRVRFVTPATPTPTVTETPMPTKTSVPATPTFTPTPTVTQQPGIAAWTFILYLSGDNNLSSIFSNTVKELEKLPYNPELNLVVLRDGSAQGDTVRLLVQPGGVYTLNVNKWKMGELNMGDPNTLQDFALWARSHYPAQHYYLSIADHGRGTTGVSWDDTSNKDYIDLQELSQVLGAVTNNGAKKIDVLGFDACLMSMLESAYQVKDYASYLVASENLGWSVFAYNLYASNSQAQTIAMPAVRAAGAANAASTPKDLAIKIASVYAGQLKGYPYTIAVMDLAEAANVKGALDALAVELSANLDTSKTNIQYARMAAQKLDSRNYNQISQDDEYVDLVDLAQKLQTYVGNSAVQTAAQALIGSVGQFVIFEHHASGMNKGNYNDLDNTHGLSIYFPPNSGTKDYLDYTGNQTFTITQTSPWDEFLVDYFGLLGLSPEPYGPVSLPPMLSLPQMLYLPEVRGK